MTDVREIVSRHRLFTRVWHWVNALAVIVMLMSGLMISNAHPMLYWGEYGANLEKPWLRVVHFPGWLTIPSQYSLAVARHWHLAFAWVMAVALLLYFVVGLINRHLQRDVFLTRRDVAPQRVWQDIKDHAALRFPAGQEASSYNPLQKIAYATTVLILLPLVVVTGLALSPGFDSITHVSAWLGGRQTARSLHFIAMVLIAGFTVIHLALVVLAGPWNEIRSMVTGRLQVEPDGAATEAHHAADPA